MYALLLRDPCGDLTEIGQFESLTAASDGALTDYFINRLYMPWDYYAIDLLWYNTQPTRIRVDRDDYELVYSTFDREGWKTLGRNDPAYKQWRDSCSYRADTVVGLDSRFSEPEDKFQYWEIELLYQDTPIFATMISAVRRSDDTDFCYECNRVTHWDADEQCGGCGRTWGHDSTTNGA